MDEAIIGGVISLVSIVVGMLVNHHLEEKRRKSVDKRWLAEYFMERKINIINELWLNLVDCKDVLLGTGADDFKSMEDFRERVTYKVDSFRKTKIFAELYISEEQTKKLNHFLGVLNLAKNSLVLNLPETVSGINPATYSDKIKEIPYDKILNSSKDAMESLKPLLNPRILKDYDDLLDDRRDSNSTG